MNKYNFETKLSTREVVDLLYRNYGYIIFPRKLNAVLRGNREPDQELREHLQEIYEDRRTRNSDTNHDWR